MRADAKRVDVARIPALRRAQLAVKLVRRLAPAGGDAGRCWVAVVCRAVEDLGHPVYQADAARYFSGATYRAHADACGLDPDAVLDALRQAQLLGASTSVAA